MEETMESILDFLSNYLGEGTAFLFGITAVSVWVRKLKKTIAEISDVFATLKKAFEDDKLTKEEIQEIWKEGKEVLESFKAFGKK